MSFERCPKIEDYFKGSLRSRVSTPAARAQKKKTTDKLVPGRASAGSDPDEGRELSFLLNKKVPGVPPSPLNPVSLKNRFDRGNTLLDISSPIGFLKEAVFNVDGGTPGTPGAFLSRSMATGFQTPSIGVFKRPYTNDSTSLLRLVSTPFDGLRVSKESLPPPTSLDSARQLDPATAEADDDVSIPNVHSIRKPNIIPTPLGALEILSKLREGSSGGIVTATTSSIIQEEKRDMSTVPSIKSTDIRQDFCLSVPFLNPGTTKDNIKLYMLFKNWLNTTSNQALYMLIQMDSINIKKKSTDAFINTVVEKETESKDWLRDQMFKSVVSRVKLVIFLAWRRRYEIFEVSNQFSMHRKLRRGFIAFQVNSNISHLTKKKGKCT
jgi:hypothetical protein